MQSCTRLVSQILFSRYLSENAKKDADLLSKLFLEHCWPSRQFELQDQQQVSLDKDAVLDSLECTRTAL